MNAMSKNLSPQDSYIRLPEVLETVKLSRTTLYRHIGNGQFPAPYDLGGRASGWLLSEVDDWIANRPRKGRSG